MEDSRELKSENEESEHSNDPEGEVKHGSSTGIFEPKPMYLYHKETVR